MLILSLFILGFSSIIIQVVMTRELVVSFYGNEFFIGWVLFSWLFWTALGCLLVRPLRMRFPDQYLLIACHLLTMILFPLGICLTRAGRGLVTVAPGQVPDLIATLATAFFVLAMTCLVLGIQFIVAARCWEDARKTKKPGGVAGKAYFWEALGFVIGGLVFSYALVLGNAFYAALIVAALNVMAVAVLFPFWGRVLVGLGMVLLLIFGYPWSVRSDLAASALRFPGEVLIETRNSIYGNLAVTRTGEQVNFYQNGLLTGSTQDDAESEYLIHFPMLSHPGPKNVLLIGTGFNGVLREILKHAPDKVVYAEMDPLLVDLAMKYVPLPLREVLSDPQVRILNGDPRSFLRHLPRDFDVVIINLPAPSTALINRYFTQDFFQQLRSHLKPDGVFATHLSFSPNFVSRPLEHLGASVYRTVKAVFPSVMILPEDELFLIASAGQVTWDPQVLIERMQARGIRNSFVTPPYIIYRYTNDRVAKVKAAFEDDTRAEKNFDLYPRGYLYNLVYWLSLFHKKAVTAFDYVTRINYFFVLCLGGLLVARPFVRGSPGQRLARIMSLGGFSLMVAEILVIYGFQVFYGNLYYRIAGIMAAFMIGLALGTWQGNRGGASLSRLMRIQAGIGVCFLVWMLILRVAARVGLVLPEAAWIGLSVTIGGLVGLIFPYVNSLLPVRKDGASSVARVYAADLSGSCLGALGASVVMIPAYGVYQTLTFLAVLNLLAAGLLARFRT